jgi:hypothetical protein
MDPLVLREARDMAPAPGSRDPIISLAREERALERIGETFNRIG